MVARDVFALTHYYTHSCNTLLCWPYPVAERKNRIACTSELDRTRILFLPFPLCKYTDFLDVIPNRERRENAFILSGDKYACGVGFPFDGADALPSKEVATKDAASGPCEERHFS